MRRAAVLTVLAALGIGTLCPPAGAVQLVAGNSVTTDGLIITVTGCQLANAMHPSQGCLATDNLELVPGAGPDASVVIKATSGDIFAADPDDPALYDLSVDLTVATVSGAARIQSAALAITGSATASDAADAFVGEDIADMSSTSLGPQMNVTLADPAASRSFSGQNFLRIHKDIGLDTWHSAGPVGLTSVIQTFAQAPEPAAVFVFLTGLLAIGACRRRV